MKKMISELWMFWLVCIVMLEVSICSSNLLVRIICVVGRKGWCFCGVVSGGVLWNEESVSMILGSSVISMKLLIVVIFS